MHDMRKKALRQSGKTVSRKAQARLDAAGTPGTPGTPGTGTPGTPGSPSPASSPAPSRSGSRFNSRQASRVNSRQGSRYASEDEDGESEPDLGQLSLGDADLDSDADSDGESEPVDDGDLASQNTPEGVFRASLDLLQDRKLANYEHRVHALQRFRRLLQDHYMGDCVAASLPTVLEQLLKSIRRSQGDFEEQLVALRCLTATTLSCPHQDSAGILDATFQTVRSVCRATETNEDCKAAAMEALTVIVLFGGGTRASADELLRFLLDVVTSDGFSVEAMDSAKVVSAALRMWSFVASYMMPADDSDDEKDAGSGGNGNGNGNNGSDASVDTDDYDMADSCLVAESQTALEAFVDQLQSTETDVQIAASEAIGLLYEMSRQYEAATGDQLDLREDPVRLAEQLRQMGRGIQPDGRSGSTKSASRLDRRLLREALTSVATSLELGTGPKFSTAGRSDLNPHKSGAAMAADGDGWQIGTSGGGDADDLAGVYGYRMRLQVQNRTILVDSWALSVRVDTLRMLLGRGMHKHLMDNPLVSQLLHAASLRLLQSDVQREQKKRLRKEKAGRKR